MIPYDHLEIISNYFINSIHFYYLIYEVLGFLRPLTNWKKIYNFYYKHTLKAIDTVLYYYYYIIYRPIYYKSLGPAVPFQHKLFRIKSKLEKYK
jgi:hypothetical protein